MFILCKRKYYLKRFKTKQNNTMKKEDKKYYCLPDGTLREIPSELEVPQQPDIIDDSLWINYDVGMKEFEEHMYNQPAIYTDEKFPVGLVEGEIEVGKCK